MRNKRRASQVLWIECIGFAALLTVSWLDELIRLPQVIFGGVAVANWHEGAIESLAIITVWVLVFVSTRRVLKRFYYLEEQLQMCGWCRKLKRQGDWVSLEEYLTKELGIETSLGICTNCGRRVFPEEEFSTRSSPTSSRSCAAASSCSRDSKART
jgi:hypothetical protein